jgi:predicted metal-dependent peptidase
MDINKIRAEYDKLKSALVAAAPFVNSILSRARVIISSSVPTAALTEHGVIVINPEFWEKLSWGGKAFVLGHEAMHGAFRDLKRIGKRDERAWNIVCDAVNNEMQKDLMKMPDEIAKFGMTLEKLSKELNLGVELDELRKMSKEELYRLLPKGGEGGGQQGGDQDPKACLDVARDLKAGAGEGEVLQKGDPQIYGDGREREGDSTDERWKDAVARGYDVQKSVGRVPASLRRIVDGLLRPQVPWHSIMRQAFRVGFGRTVISSYKRPSRKHPDFPGIKRYALQRTWNLIDTSGSIGEKELMQELSEVYDQAGDRPVAVICFDAKEYGVVEAKSKQEVITKVISSVKGGGGTVIADALRNTLSRMQYRDNVVILSDFDIYDLKESETEQLLSAVAAKSGVAILVSSRLEVSIPGWRFIKVTPD